MQRIFDSLQSLVVPDMQEIMNKERMDEGKARISEDWGDFVSIETMPGCGDHTERCAYCSRLRDCRI